MINRDKIIRIVAKKTKSKIKVVEPIVNAYEDAILECLLSGEEVWLRNFLTFRIKRHVSKIFYDPKTGQKRRIDGKKRIKVVVSECVNEMLEDYSDD